MRKNKNDVPPPGDGREDIIVFFSTGAFFSAFLT